MERTTMSVQELSAQMGILLPVVQRIGDVDPFSNGSTKRGGDPFLGATQTVGDDVAQNVAEERGRYVHAGHAGLLRLGKRP